jgi:hypothetical protein
MTRLNSRKLHLAVSDSATPKGIRLQHFKSVSARKRDLRGGWNLLCSWNRHAGAVVFTLCCI